MAESPNNLHLRVLVESRFGAENASLLFERTATFQHALDASGRHVRFGSLLALVVGALNLDQLGSALSVSTGRRFTVIQEDVSPQFFLKFIPVLKECRELGIVPLSRAASGEIAVAFVDPYRQGDPPPPVVVDLLARTLGVASAQVSVAPYVAPHLSVISFLENAAFFSSLGGAVAVDRTDWLERLSDGALTATADRARALATRDAEAEHFCDALGRELPIMGSTRVLVSILRFLRLVVPAVEGNLDPMHARVATALVRRILGALVGFRPLLPQLWPLLGFSPWSGNELLRKRGWLLQTCEELLAKLREDQGWTAEFLRGEFERPEHRPDGSGGDLVTYGCSSLILRGRTVQYAMLKCLASRDGTPPKGVKLSLVQTPPMSIPRDHLAFTVDATFFIAALKHVCGARVLDHASLDQIPERSALLCGFVHPLPDGPDRRRVLAESGLSRVVETVRPVRIVAVQGELKSAFSAGLGDFLAPPEVLGKYLAELDGIYEPFLSDERVRTVARRPSPSALERAERTPWPTT